MKLNISRRKVVTVVSITVAVLILAHCLWLVSYFKINDPEILDFSRLLDLDYEGNIPTLFAAILFMLNGALFYLLGQGNKQSNTRGCYYWYGLAVIFIFMGVDEGSRLHEEIGDVFEEIVNAEGALFFPWVIPYVGALLVAVIVYFRFYLGLDRWLQIRLFLCAFIFLSGAVGFEMLSATQADEYGTESLSYSVLYTVEETLEFAGLILLLDTLLAVLAKNQPKFEVLISDS